MVVLILRRGTTPHRDLEPVRVPSNGLVLITLFRGPVGLALESLYLEGRQVQALGVVTLRSGRVTEMSTGSSPIHPVVPRT